MSFTAYAINEAHMKLRIFASALATAIVTATASGPAHATLFCEVVKTRDNFVALRAAPDPQAKMLMRMKAGGEVMLAGEQRTGWEKVHYWPGDDRIEKGEAARKITGWVNRKLIDMCG